MRNPFLFFGSFFLVYSLAVLYIARRTRQGSRRLAGVDNRLWYSGLTLLSAAYFLPRLLASQAPTTASAAYPATLLPASFESLLAWGGGLWLAAVYYSTLLFLLADLTWLGLSRWLPVAKPVFRVRSAAGVWLVVTALCGYGTYNALTPVVTEYDVALPGQFEPFRMAAVSDVHLGRQVGDWRLRQLVDLLNAQQADAIVLLGDTIDDDLEPVQAFNGAAGLRRLSARWGVYAIMGNHEYLRKRGEEYAAYLKNRAGLRLLRNETVRLPNGVALIGREDFSQERQFGGQNPFLTAAKRDIGPQAPAIVLDHQPNRLAETVAAGLALQLSGHTHVGQMAPNQFIVRNMYPIDYGVAVVGPAKLIVSSGFGTWGPPLRIGNQPEILLLRISPQP